MIFDNYDLQLHGVRLPEFTLNDETLKELNCDQSTPHSEVLKRLCESGLKKRVEEGKISLDEIPKYEARYTKELVVLNSGGFEDYAFIVWDIIRFARENNIPKGAARGCFIPESRVKMGNGSLKEIQNIKIGDKVIDAFGDERKVVDTLIYDVEEDIVEILLENGNLIKCTKDHKILTTNRGWVEAQFVDEKDDLKEI
jgi:hypothetical protein